MNATLLLLKGLAVALLVVIVAYDGMLVLKAIVNKVRKERS